MQGLKCAVKRGMVCGLGEGEMPSPRSSPPVAGRRVGPAPHQWLQHLGEQPALCLGSTIELTPGGIDVGEPALKAVSLEEFALLLAGCCIG